MGFLSGVLSAVKDDEAVKTYDNYITPDDKKLQNVLNTLNTKIGSGRAGLVDAVAEVKGWLEGYELEYLKKTSNVTEFLGELKTNIAGKYTSQIDAGENLTRQLEEWKRTVENIERDIKTIETNYVIHLDDALKYKIHSEVILLKKTVEVLRDSACNISVNEQAKHVDTHLDEQKRNLENAVKDGSENVKHTLQINFTKILDAMYDLREQRKHHFEKCYERLREANKHVNSCLDKYTGTTRDAIFKLFDEIINDVKKIYGDLNYKKGELEMLVEEAEKTLSELSKHLEKDVKAGVEQDLTTLNGNINIIKNDMGPNSTKHAIVGKALTQLGAAKQELLQTTNPIIQQSKSLADTYNKSVKKQFYNFAEALRAAKLDNFKDNLRMEKLKLRNYFDTLMKVGTIKNVPASSKTEVNELVDELNGAIDTINKRYESLSTGTVVVATTTFASAVKTAAGAINSLGTKITRELTQAKQMIEDTENNKDFSTAVGELGNLQSLQNSIYGEKGTTNKPETGSLAKLIEELSTAIGTTSDADGGKLNIAIGAFEASARQQINYAATTAIEHAVGKVVAEMQKFKEEDKGLFSKTEVGKKVTGLQAHIKTLEGFIKEKTKGTLYVKLNEIQKDLEALDKLKIEDTNEQRDGVINKKKKAADKKMQELYNEIFDKLNAVFNTLNDADRNLTHTIDIVTEGVHSAYAASTKSVENIKDYLLRVTSQAFDTVTSAVRILFSEQHVADLGGLKTLVDGQLRKMEQIIQKDRRTAIKGLLQTLNGRTYIVNTGKYPKFGMPSARSLLDAIIQVAQSSTSTLNGEAHLQQFQQLSTEFHAYYNNVNTYINNQVNSPTSTPPTSQTTDPATQLTKIKEDFDELLEHLQDNSNPRRIHNYDHTFTGKFASLKNATNDLSPSTFANPRHPELLDAVKKGLQGFVEQMERVYVNKYEGSKGFKWIEKGEKEVLTVDGRNGAKVFVSILELLYHDLFKLLQGCVKGGDSHDKNIRLNDLGEEGNKTTNPLGNWLHERGYMVSDDERTQNGELDRRKNGKQIMELYLKTIIGANNAHLTTCKPNGRTKDFRILDILRCLTGHLGTYYSVCHYQIFSKPKAPCNIYQMLHWVCGLWHHPGLYSLRVHLMEQFPKPKGEEHKTHKDIGSKRLILEAHPDVKIDPNDLTPTLRDVCGNSHDVLVAILGNGNAEGRYACEFRINPDGLSYPADPAQCLDMLLDILRRLFLQFRYISNRCNVAAENNGWRDCQYGKDISTTKSHCIKQPETEPTDQARSQPNGQANGQPTCQAACQVNTKPNCQPTSPLMSLLNDCLPGHFPHILESVGCKAQCRTCSPSTSGKPCLTPFGFRAFTGSTKTGKYLCNVLNNFINNKYLSALFCLVPNPPKTLPEHFGFALSLVKDWVNTTKLTKNLTDMFPLQSKFESSMEKLSIKLCPSPSVLTNALASAYGSESGVHQSCQDHHLRSLTSSDLCINESKNIQCAPYLTTLCCDSYNYLAYKNSDAYVSWAAYLPWNFWQQLNNLYNDFCNIFCQEWGCQKCLRGDTCKKGSHGSVDDKSGIPHCRCQSIVRCKGVSPTLYQYGFAFGNASVLNKSDYEKTCFDFCKQLNKMLKSTYFTDLFKECDEFLFTIRQPFIWLNVTLWLLSLLYLLHIMVIRLDLLHIKSHLHSPSSHRIAAQSLLAAARVNKLNRVFYLQP